MIPSNTNRGEEEDAGEMGRQQGRCGNTERRRRGQKQTGKKLYYYKVISGNIDKEKKGIVRKERVV